MPLLPETGTTYRDIMELTRDFVLPIVGYVAHRITRIDQKLQEQNGRLGKMEMRVADHITNDEEKIAALHSDVREIRAKQG